MAIIPLRHYNREIEGLIDTGQLDEAVAHCRHILETFPKHIATYRLLGKAYMEQQRYGDATDIFQRVLSSVPDDQVANIGLSIIREDEGNLDAAIWYMERALEAQPSNSAIKDELRRLYGRRDGIEPPKVRLTRGALARMYSRGGLYDQAIAELRAALADDPQRPDLMVLLAQMHFYLGQQLEAVDICGTIIKQLPYCLVANRILASILPQTKRADDTKAYHQRAVAMDPYFSSAPSQNLSADSVPESAINIERLEYRPGRADAGPSQPAWAASLGIAFEESQSEKLPEWLQDQGDLEDSTRPDSRPIPTAPFSWETPDEDITPLEEPTKVEDIIPDWMKEAGWQPAPDEGSAEEASSELELSPEQPIDEIVKAEIPDWLKDLAPKGTLDEEPTADQDEQGDIDLPWLQKTTPGASDTIVNWLGAQKQPSDAEETPDAEIKPAEEPEEQAAPPGPPTRGENGGLPDWLQGVEATYGKSGITDWLKSSHLEEYEAAAHKESAAEDSAQMEEEIPEWYEEQEEDAAPVEELPEWLREMGEVSPKPAPTEPISKEAASSDEEIPDWLKEMGKPEQEPTLIKHADDELPLPSEELPAWLEEMDEGEPQPTPVEPTAEEAALPAEEFPEWLTELGKAEPEPTFDQLTTEGIAIPAEELPDWLEELKEAEPMPTYTEPILEEVAVPAEEVPDWLQEMEEVESETTFTEPVLEDAATPAEELPEWIQEMEEAEPETTLPEPAPEEFSAPVEEIAIPEEELPDWQSEIGASETEQIPAELKEIDLQVPELVEPAQTPESSADLTRQPEDIETFESSIKAPALPAEELPDWLKDTGPLTHTKSDGSYTEDGTEEEPALADIELPDWLQEFGQPESTELGASPIEAETIPTDEAPIWLQDTAQLATPAIEAADGGASESSGDRGDEVYPVEEPPEWLRELEQPPAESAIPFDDKVGEDAALAWLETLAAKHSPQEEVSTKPDEHITAQPAAIEPDQPTEELPDWLTEITETPTEQPFEKPSAETAMPFIDQSEQDAALAWLEQLAAQHGAKEEELITKPEERLETIPDWIKIGAEEAQQDEELHVQPADEIEPISPAEQLPEWLMEIAASDEAQPPFETTAKEQIESAEEVTAPLEELPEWLQELTEPIEDGVPVEPSEQPSTAPVDVADQDAALAWLESLAAQHGAKEEELITRPEDRRDTMPDWIEQEVRSEAEAEKIPTQPVPVAQPELTEAAVEKPEAHIEDQSGIVKEILEPEIDLPVAEEYPTPAEELPDWLLETAAPGDASILPDEQIEIEQLSDWLKETAISEQQLPGDEPESDLEKLPAWLRETDHVAPEDGEISPSIEQTAAPAWMPEAILPEAELPTAPSPPLKVLSELEEEEYSEQEPELIPSELPPEPININTAPLSQLEKLSGIGFVLGQRIINYREENGPFTEVDDLMNVTGIGPVVIDNLRHRLTTGIPAIPEEELPEVETEEWLLNKARKDVEKGDVAHASELYSQLIAQGVELGQVISDMQDALYRFPLDINLWQTLGDAYLRADRLQEALDAYTKAEELLR